MADDFVARVTYLLGPHREHLQAHAAAQPGVLTMVVDDPAKLRGYAIVKGDTVRLCGIDRRVLDSQAKNKTDWAIAIQTAVANHGVVTFIECTHDIWAAAQERKAAAHD